MSRLPAGWPGLITTMRGHLPRESRPRCRHRQTGPRATSHAPNGVIASVI